MSEAVRDEARRLSVRLAAARRELQTPAPTPEAHGPSRSGRAIEASPAALDGFLGPSSDRLAELQRIVDDLAAGGAAADALTGLDALADRRPESRPR